MPAASDAALVVLLHIEVIGDPQAFTTRWSPWITDSLRSASGCLQANVHREDNGRRMLLIHGWRRDSDWERWQASPAADEHRALLDEHAARTAQSLWRPEQVTA